MGLRPFSFLRDGAAARREVHAPGRVARSQIGNNASRAV
jgi:hypothetical protein